MPRRKVSKQPVIQEITHPQYNAYIRPFAGKARASIYVRTESGHFALPHSKTFDTAIEAEEWIAATGDDLVLTAAGIIRSKL